MGDLLFNAMAAWNLNKFLTNLNSNLNTWGKMGVAVVGVIMVIVAVVKIAKGLMSDRSQTNWVMCLVLLFVGGALAFGSGWSLTQDMSQMGETTLTNMGAAITWDSSESVTTLDGVIN